MEKLAKEQKLGTEEMGRKIRYEFFNEVAQKENANKIATAHNLNDNVETVLMNILRGRRKLRNKGECSECNSGKSAGSRCDLCLRPDSDASRTEGICGSKSYYLLDFYGRKNGMRNRCLSGMCLQIKRYRCTFSGT